MKIEYNKVTWYSITLAIVMYVGIFALAYYLGNKCCSLLNPAPVQLQQQNQANNKITSASFTCVNNKYINAIFFNEKVELTLSDKRNLLLLRGISASGARYTNTDQSIVFWNKGDTAFIEENGQKTYDCYITPEYPR